MQSEDLDFRTVEVGRTDLGLYNASTNSSVLVLVPSSYREIRFRSISRCDSLVATHISYSIPNSCIFSIEIQLVSTPTL
jgi:hypothetical protein